MRLFHRRHHHLRMEEVVEVEAFHQKEEVEEVVAGSGWLGEGVGAAFMATSTEGWNAGSLRGPILRGDG